MEEIMGETVSGQDIRAEYQDKLRIDRSDIDLMLETQADRHQWMVEQSANADHAFRAAVTAVEVATAKAFKRLKIPNEAGKVMSDTAAKQYAPVEPEVLELIDKRSTAQYTAKILGGAVLSFQQRKTMIAKISEREVLTFYGDPSQKGKLGSFAQGAENVLKDDMGGN